MWNVNRKWAAAGLLAASALMVSPVLASTPGAQATAPSVNSLAAMPVGLPDASLQPITVAIPVSGQPVTAQEQRSVKNRAHSH